MEKYYTQMKKEESNADMMEMGGGVGMMEQMGVADKCPFEGSRDEETKETRCPVTQSIANIEHRTGGPGGGACPFISSSNLLYYLEKLLCSSY